MTTEARPILRDHLAALFKLKVGPDQHGLVAPNEVTLAQAAYEPGSQVWGLWSGEAPVGLVAMIDTRIAPGNFPDDDPDAAYLWRLLIGVDHQGQGHGHAALAHAVAVTRAWGQPKLAVGVADLPNGADAFYIRAGFRPTGRLLDGDRELMLRLDDFRPPLTE